MHGHLVPIPQKISRPPLLNNHTYLLLPLINLHTSLLDFMNEHIKWFFHFRFLLEDEEGETLEVDASDEAVCIYSLATLE